jgi:O-antigen/teichoic acid export membrane protein
MSSKSSVSYASENSPGTHAQDTSEAGQRRLRSRLLSGSAIMLVSSGVVGATNLIYNLVVAHGLGAAGFGHASAVYTVLMLLSAVTLSFQLLCSKFVARTDMVSMKVGIYRFLHRRAWFAAILVTALLLYASPVISSYLNLPTRNYIDLLAAGVIFFIPLGVRRGFMQGMYDFPHLALNFVLEVVVKLVGAVLLINAGVGVLGVIAAVVASVMVAYLVGVPGKALQIPSHSTVPAAFEEGVQTTVFFVGQVIINNLDIILVKHFFSATEAGVYAAVALVGRVVYMLSWSVVSSMFPFSARVPSHERDGRTVLSTALLLVVLITSLFTLGVWLAPSRLWAMVLGAGFPAGLESHFSSLLVLYAATTGIYSMGVVLMSYEISRKIGNVSWLQLGISAAIFGGIYLMHNSLQNVITVQLVLMMVLLVLVSIPFLRAQSRSSGNSSGGSVGENGIHRLRRVPEEEIIAEFLKSEFYQPEFDRYREQFRKIVDQPNFESPRENELRRALLYLRRGRLWRELPPDTEWWEVELEPEHLASIRVFPRNHWRSFAHKGFQLSDMIERIRSHVESAPADPFVVKLRSLATKFENTPGPFSSVLLIGIDDTGPFTIIEGNHRMAAASLVAPGEVHRRFRFLCGYSPRMTECCWYQTDLATLWKYARNFMTYLLDDHDVIIQQAMVTRMDVPPIDPSGLGAA